MQLDYNVLWVDDNNIWRTAAVRKIKKCIEDCGFIPIIAEYSNGDVIFQKDFDLAKKNVYFELQTAYINMIQLEKEIPLMAVKVRQTKENFELADGRYAVGLGDYIELQDAKQNYNVAQNTYVHTVYNYGVARANLEKLIAIPQEITITVED